MKFANSPTRTDRAFVRSMRVAGVALAASLFGTALVAQADVFSEIRYTDLVARLGASVPSGSNIRMGQVEATENAQGSYAPDTTLAEFAGTTFNLMSGSTPPASWHGTEVAKSLYGNTLSIVPGVNTVHVWSVNPWLTTGGLNVGSGLQPLNTPPGVRVHNHSWIGSFGNPSSDNDALRRVDLVASRDNVLFTAGVNNGAGSVPQALVAYCFNGIAVGLSTGNHAAAPAPFGIDGPGRRKPDIVAPGVFTSFATPVVGAAAALLFDAALVDPAINSNTNAFRALTIKSVLMAGTTHRMGWSNGAPVSGASRGITTTPLDPVYGADLLNIDRSHRILTSGERNGSSTPQFASFLPSTGWDYIQSQASGASTYYSFRVHEPIDEASIVATWFRQVATNFSSFNVQNFDLRLWRASGGALQSISGESGVGVFSSGNVESKSTIDNTEHLYLRDLAAGDYVLELRRVPGTQSLLPVVVSWYMPRTTPAADLNGDGIVGAADLAILLSQWGGPGSGYLNGDGIVGGPDMAALLSVWG